MHGAIYALALGLLLGGCVKLTAGNELAQAGGGSAAAASNGVILFGFESVKEEDPIFWSVAMNRLDPRTGRPEPSDGTNEVAFRQFGGMLERDERYAAFTVRPGEYAVTGLVPAQQSGLFMDLNFRDSAGQAATMGLVGLASLAVLGTAANAERAAEEARFGKRGRSPLVYLGEDGTLSPDAPRFTVEPGEVVYLGEFLFGTRRYYDERPDIGGGAGAKWVRVFSSPFVEHAIDEGRARAGMAKLGLSRWPMRTVRPKALASGPVYYAPYLTRERVDWLSSGTVIREEVVHARPGAASAPDRTAAPAPGSATGAVTGLSGTSREELQRRFLAGEISIEQYRAAMAARR